MDECRKPKIASADNPAKPNAKAIGRSRVKHGTAGTSPWGSMIIFQVATLCYLKTVGK